MDEFSSTNIQSADCYDQGSRSSSSWSEAHISNSEEDNLDDDSSGSSCSCSLCSSSSCSTCSGSSGSTSDRDLNNEIQIKNPVLSCGDVVKSNVAGDVLLTESPWVLSSLEPSQELYNERCLGGDTADLATHCDQWFCDPKIDCDKKRCEMSESIPLENPNRSHYNLEPCIPAKRSPIRITFDGKKLNKDALMAAGTQSAGDIDMDGETEPLPGTGLFSLMQNYADDKKHSEIQNDVVAKGELAVGSDGNVLFTDGVRSRGDVDKQYLSTNPGPKNSLDSGSPLHEGLRRSRLSDGRSRSISRQKNRSTRKEISVSLSERKRSRSTDRRSRPSHIRSRRPMHRWSQFTSRRSQSPNKRSGSLYRKSVSPNRSSQSPNRRSWPQNRRSGSPRKRSGSPHRRSNSQYKMSSSPDEKSCSSNKGSGSPNRKSWSLDRSTGSLKRWSPNRKLRAPSNRRSKYPSRSLKPASRKFRSPSRSHIRYPMSVCGLPLRHRSTEHKRSRSKSLSPEPDEKHPGVSNQYIPMEARSTVSGVIHVNPNVFRCNNIVSHHSVGYFGLSKQDNVMFECKDVNIGNRKLCSLYGNADVYHPADPRTDLLKQKQNPDGVPQVSRQYSEEYKKYIEQYYDNEPIKYGDNSNVSHIHGVDKDVFSDVLPPGVSSHEFMGSVSGLGSVDSVDSKQAKHRFSRISAGDVAELSPTSPNDVGDHRQDVDCDRKGQKPVIIPTVLS
ncbi:hypothetical protein LSH36_173g05027 [Paralvinella palmiformis]|uniref:Uncharacterized protein n=1 Tax=Paralvinella palmiformis TaxID=53620 RepID=A0AAD9N7H7_9ANNE|nr:hypothetical protein LSH36_173g05027 [Paralvinella palmiformis]